MIQKIINANIMNTDLKIVNGMNANYKKYPFFASIQRRGSSTPFCGGSYIGGKYRIVITAAHCVNSYRNSPRSIQVAFRKSSIFAKGLVYDVKRIRIHPNYNTRTLDYDIALVYLRKRPARSVKTIRLPTGSLARRFIRAGNRVYIIGFGATSSGGSSSKILQFANVKIINKDNKVENRYPSNELTNRMILAADYNKWSDPNDNEDSCQGDSGGPLFDAYKRKWYLVGLTSWGYSCALTGYPGVYTNLYAIRGWIRKHARV